MNRARLSPSCSTSWSNDFSQSSVSASSMSGSWCLNSSKYMTGPSVSGRLEAQRGREVVGLEHRPERRALVRVLRLQRGGDALDRVRVIGRDRGGRQPAAVDVDGDGRVGLRLLVPAALVAVDAADEDLAVVDHDPDDGLVGGAAGRDGLDPDLLGGVDRLEVLP